MAQGWRSSVVPSVSFSLSLGLLGNSCSLVKNPHEDTYLLEFGMKTPKQLSVSSPSWFWCRSSVRE